MAGGRSKKSGGGYDDPTMDMGAESQARMLKDYGGRMPTSRGVQNWKSANPSSTKQSSSGNPPEGSTKGWGRGKNIKRYKGNTFGDVPMNEPVIKQNKYPGQ